MFTRDETLDRLRATLDHPATARELIQRLAIPGISGWPSGVT